MLDAKLVAVELVPPVVSLVPKVVLDAKLFAVVISIVSVAGMEPGDRCSLLVCRRTGAAGIITPSELFLDAKLFVVVLSGIVFVVGTEACDRCGLLAGFESCVVFL